jgi:YVTN family beta-propeller protein
MYNDTVSVISTATNQVVATISVGSTPCDIAITPDGIQAYVKNCGNSTVSVINMVANRVQATVPIGRRGDSGNAPSTMAITLGYSTMAITPDGAQVYVANILNNTVSVISTAINRRIATVLVGEWPEAVAITPDGTKVYVANGDSGSISVIDTAVNQVIATVSVGIYPTAVAITPDGTKVYVVNEGSGSISVIDITTNQVTATIWTGGDYTSSSRIAITPDGTKAYVANVTLGTFSVIDIATNQVVATTSIENGPIVIAMVQISNGGRCVVSIAAVVSSIFILFLTINLRKLIYYV